MGNTSLSASLYSLAVVDYLRARDAPGYVYNSARSEWLLINGLQRHGRRHNHREWRAYVRDLGLRSHQNAWRSAAKGPFVMDQNEGGLAIYDTTNDRIIYFGGLTGANQRSNDVWQLKADEYGMYVATKLAPTGTAPTQRWLMAGCYDAANQRLVLWGGQSASSVLGDVWQLSLTEGSEAWTQLTPTGTAPTAAWQPCFAYDNANKRLYIHAGATDTNGTVYTSQLFYLDVSTAACNWVNTGVTGGLGVRGAGLGYDSIISD